MRFGHARGSELFRRDVVGGIRTLAPVFDARNLLERHDFARPASAGEGELVGTNFERKFRREGRPFHAMTLVRR